MNKEVQQKYIELQLLNQQIKKVQEQFLLFQQQLGELTSLETSLVEMRDIKKDVDMFSSLGSGIFVNSKIVDNENVLVNVGAGIIVKKSVSEAVNLVKSQIETISKSLESIKEQFVQASSYSQQLTEELNALAQKETN